MSPTKAPDGATPPESPKPTEAEVKLARGVLSWERVRYEALGDPSGWTVDNYRGWRIVAYGCNIYFDDEFEARAALIACQESYTLARSILDPRPLSPEPDEDIPFGEEEIDLRGCQTWSPS